MDDGSFPYEPMVRSACNSPCGMVRSFIRPPKLALTLTRQPPSTCELGIFSECSNVVVTEQNHLGTTI